MGCACSRNSGLNIDQGNYSISTKNSPGKLILQIVIHDSSAWALLNRSKTSTDQTLTLSDENIKRMEIESQILEEGFLFNLKELEFDDDHIELLFSPMIFEINFNEKYFGKLALTNLKYALFVMSKEKVILHDVNNEELLCEVHYSVIGPYFDNLRFLKLNHLTEEEQLELCYKIIYSRNNEKTLFGKDKLQVRLFLGDFKIEVKVQIFENLITIPGGRACKAVKEFLNYFNPYNIRLQLSFKNFMANVVFYDDALEEYARNLIETNMDDNLIYENKECLLLMLKQAFYRGSDPKGYFSKLLKNTRKESKYIKEMLNIVDLNEKVFFPAFKRDRPKAMKVCNFMLGFEGMEAFLTENWKELEGEINLDEIDKEENIEVFKEFVLKLKNNK